MKRAFFIGLGLLLVLLFCVQFRPPAESESESESVASLSHNPAQSPGSHSAADKSLPGDELLADYASSASTARKDLRQILRVFDNALVLVKQADTRHYATNEDLADFLRGRNRNQTPFVSPNSKIFGPDGSIRDRWGNPLRIHPVSEGKIEIRSAGPDGIAWNEDDVLVDSPQ